MNQQVQLLQLFFTYTEGEASRRLPLQYYTPPVKAKLKVACLSLNHEFNV